MSSLRTLVITPDFPPAPGGIQLLAHRLVSHTKGITCRTLTLQAPGAGAWDEAQGLDVRRFPTHSSRRLTILRLNAAAVAEARRFRPQVILLMHIIAAPAAAIIAETHHIPIVTYMHATEVPARPKVAALASRKSERIVAVSRYTADLARAAGADPERVRVIPPGVDWRKPAPVKRRDTPTVVTVARLEDRYKGHDVMVRAMPLVRSRVPGAEWVVLGDGPLRKDIERLAAAHGVQGAIHLRGTVSDDERDYWLDTAHVLAMPSRVPPNGGAGEGFGIAYLEAGVHGLPVVAGGVGGALDAVVDGKTGLLVDPTNHVEVADAIVRLLQDRDAAARMGAAGSERAREHAWPEIARRVDELIAETVRGA
jgi:phosphatidylinositol alpha-1,6-mannosyltransferase